MAECIEWPGARFKTGYGAIKRNGRTQRVNRWVWEQANGPIPPGKCVLHHCDNPPCYLLAHLFLGTKAENNADMAAKGRARKVPQPGETNPYAKLTAVQVVEIRAALAVGEVQRQIAQRYGVSTSAITAINTGQNWRLG